MADYDMVVSDDELADMGKAYQSFGELLEESLDAYLEILSNTAATAIHSGQTAQNLRLFLLQANALKGQIAELSDHLLGATVHFQYWIDSADEDIYPHVF